jgi:hypothetical protein
MLFPNANPGRRGWKPAFNRLSYGTAQQLVNPHKLESEATRQKKQNGTTVKQTASAQQPENLMMAS